jgi:hypothetical protein
MWMNVGDFSDTILSMCAQVAQKDLDLTPAEAEAAGAFLILNNIDSYTSNFTGANTAMLELRLVA